MTIYQKTSETIRLKRLELGYSQNYMALKLSMTQQAYSKIENNPKKCALQTLVKIAELLQLDLSLLFHEDNHASVPEKQIQFQLNKILQKLNELKELTKKK